MARESDFVETVRVVIKKRVTCSGQGREALPGFSRPAPIKRSITENSAGLSGTLNKEEIHNATT